MKRALSIHVAILQVVAVLLLQWYPVARHLSRPATQRQCRGNHAECGCSPERIASRSCCCFHLRPACHQEQHHQAEHSESAQDGERAVPTLSTAPCGSTPLFIVASLDDFKFLRVETLRMHPAGYFRSFPRPGPETARGLFIPPPDPPPKLSLLA